MTYVLSDIHGRIDPYHRMLKRIHFSENDNLYILGDIIDRNPDGIEIMKEVMDRKNIHMLLGNHEYMMANTLSTDVSDVYQWEEYYDLWAMNGGEVTFDAYYKESIPMQNRILSYIYSLPLEIEITTGDHSFLLVHAAPSFIYKPGMKGYRDKTEFAVWERISPWEKVDFPQDFMICGHTPTRHFNNKKPMEVFQSRNIIWIDCGCAYGIERGGRLACLSLENRKIYYENA